MRAIKFRLWLKEWDENGGKMFYNVMPCSKDFKTWLISFDDDDVYDGEFEVGKDVEVMQYTGLKDVNKELNVSYVDDFTKLEKHISNLRINAIGLSNELQGKSKQLQTYKDKEDKLREYIRKNVFVGQELINKEDTENGFITEVKSLLFKIIPTNEDFITNILQILNEGSDE